MADLTRVRQTLARARGRLADAGFVFLSTALWVSVTILLALGCLVLLAILVADGHPARFFLHAQNLAGHYLAAGAAARARFHGQLGAFFLGLVLLLGIGRAPSFARHLRDDLARERPHD